MITCNATFIKDPDNKWFITVDWSEWVAGIIEDIGGGATVSITSSAWYIYPEGDITMDPATPGTADANYKCFFYATGGVEGNTYNVINRITYNPSTLSPTDFTEDRTVKVKIKQK